MHFLSDPKDEQHDPAFESEAASESGSASGSASDEGSDVAHDEDADAPRVAQWVDVDSEAESQAEGESDDSDSDAHDVSSAKPSRDLVRSRFFLSLVSNAALLIATRSSSSQRSLEDGMVLLSSICTWFLELTRARAFPRFIVFASRHATQSPTYPCSSSRSE